MPPAMRAAMGAAAVRAAEAIGYVGAGTIEFIADVARRARPRALLLHGDEHPPPGRAPGDRADHRHRPRRVAAAHRRGRAAAAAARTSSRSTATRSRRGSMPRIRPGGFLPSTGRLRHLAMPPASREVRDRQRGARGRRDHAVLRSDDRQADRARPRPRPCAEPDGDARWSRSRRSAARPTRRSSARWCAMPRFAAGRVDTGLIERRLDALLAAAAPESDDALVFAALDAIGIFAAAPDARPLVDAQGLAAVARRAAVRPSRPGRASGSTCRSCSWTTAASRSSSRAARWSRASCARTGATVTLDLGERLIGATVIRGEGEVGSSSMAASTASR